MNINAILVPVDGSTSSVHAVEYAIEALKGRDDAVLHLLTVQTPVISGNAQRFVSAELIADYYHDEGAQALKPAKAVLEKAGMAYREHMEIGPIAETINRYAREHGCGLIVMGTRGLGSVAGLFLGSVTTKVLALADLPVTLVK